MLAQARERDAQLIRGEIMAAAWLSARCQGSATGRGIRTTIGIAAAEEFRADGPTRWWSSACGNAGAIFIGKTNTPEFGLGSHTYNPVFGTTLTRTIRSKTAGGSSGGAAVALALRMLPVADGSDYGGSLRNPAGVQ